MTKDNKSTEKQCDIHVVTRRFICDSCEEEWEESFKCDKCSGLKYIPDYDMDGFDQDGKNCLISTCFNCCDGHRK